MKIRRILLNNLNSLRGKHIIDLTVEPLSNAGLFAITGPTGAGKSTLLDAITLALYGRAARYGTERNPENMMSRNCGECSAEVEFEVPKGNFRAAWQLRCARGKANERIQPARRYIYDEDGVTLAQQVSRCDALIVDLIGLDYGRFVRSVMLAQGEFARFLKANANERSELLECLTGTEIYSDLGILAHKEATRRQDDLEIRQQLLEQIEILEGEERKEVEDHITELIIEKHVLEEDLENKSKIAVKIDKLESGLTQKKKITEHLEVLEASWRDAESDLTLLKRHRETVPFQDDLIRLQNAEDTAQSSEEKRQAAQDEREERYEQHQQARLNYYRILRSEIAEHESTIQKAKARACEANETLKAENEWLEAHRIDSDLSDRIADLAASLTELKSRRATLRRELKQVSDITSVLGSGAIETLPPEINEKELKSTLNTISEKLEEEHQNTADKRTTAMKELDFRKDHLQKARLIAKHDTHRASLVKGEPCPLCGATEHPYAEGHEPGVPFEDLEGEVARAEETCSDLTYRVSNLTEARKELTSQQSNAINARQDLAKYEEELLDSLSDFEVTLPEEGKEEEVRKSLQKREKAYQTHRENFHDKEQVAKQTREDENNVRGLLDKRSRDLQQLDVFDTEDVEIVKDLAEQLGVEEAERVWSDRETALKVQEAELKRQLRDANAARESLEQIRGRLISALDGSDFRNLDDLRAAKLDQEEANRIEQIETDLKNKEHDLTTRLKVAREEIEFLREAEIPEGDKAEQFKAAHERLQKNEISSSNSLQSGKAGSNWTIETAGNMATSRNY